MFSDLLSSIQIHSYRSYAAQSTINCHPSHMKLPAPINRQTHQAPTIRFRKGRERSRTSNITRISLFLSLAITQRIRTNFIFPRKTKKDVSRSIFVALGPPLLDLLQLALDLDRQLLDRSHAFRKARCTVAAGVFHVG